MQFVTRIDELYDIKISQKGAGSKLSTTVTQRFLNTVDRCGSLKAMQVKRNNEWKKWSFIDYHKDCKVCHSLLSSSRISIILYKY